MRTTCNSTNSNNCRRAVMFKGLDLEIRILGLNIIRRKRRSSQDPDSIMTPIKIYGIKRHLILNSLELNENQIIFTK